MAAPYQLPDLIMTRLATLEWPVRHVAELGSGGVEAQIAPAVLVIPYGLQIADDGDETAALERVLVVAVTRSINQRGGQEARQKAGEMLASAATLLKSWQPTTGHTPLEFETPPQPQFIDAVALYPLLFSSNYTLKE